MLQLYNPIINIPSKWRTFHERGKLFMLKMFITESINTEMFENNLNIQ